MKVHRKQKLHSGVDLQSLESGDDRQCLVYAVLGVCCTQCYLMLMAWRDGEG